MIRLTPKEFFKQFLSYKKDLREVCREMYGDDFVEMYDMVNQGIPIGNFEETIVFTEMVAKARERLWRY